VDLLREHFKNILEPYRGCSVSLLHRPFYVRQAKIVLLCIHDLVLDL